MNLPAKALLSNAASVPPNPPPPSAGAAAHPAALLAATAGQSRRESLADADPAAKTRSAEDSARAAPTPLPAATAGQRILGESGNHLQLQDIRLHLIEGRVASTNYHQLRPVDLN
jgi:hypothetical protein